VATYDPYFFVAIFLALIPFVPFLFLFRVRSNRKGPDLLDGALTAPAPRSPMKVNELVLLSIVAVSIFSSWGLFNSLMSLIVTKTAVGVTSSQAYLTPGVFNLSSLLLQPFMGRLGSRRPHLWITLGVGSNAATLFALTLTNNIWMIYLLTFIAGACFATVSPASLSQLMAKVPRNYHGRVLGIYGGAEDIGIIIGPFVGSVVWQLFGVTTSFLSIALVLVIALTIYVSATRPRRMKTNETQILTNR
jgi:MFS family permease